VEALIDLIINPGETHGGHKTITKMITEPDLKNRYQELTFMADIRPGEMRCSRLFRFGDANQNE
jgi:hypothetical protein